jgi:hypothetical protein
MDKPHIAPPYMDRSMTGAQSMLARKSAEEAPEVSMYNYDNVGNVVGMDSMTTDFGLLGQDQFSTSLYGHVGKERKPVYDATTLLNDAWFCIMTDDGGKLYQILTTLQEVGVKYPAEHPYETMFGSTTLWERVNDSSLFQNAPKNLRDARTLLERYRAPQPKEEFNAPPSVNIYDRRAFLR